MSDDKPGCTICTESEDAGPRWNLYPQLNPMRDGNATPPVLCGPCWRRWTVFSMFLLSARLAPGMFLTALLIVWLPLPGLGEFAALIHGVPLILTVTWAMFSQLRNGEARFEAYAHRQRGALTARASIHRRR